MSDKETTEKNREALKKLLKQLSHGKPSSDQYSDQLKAVIINAKKTALTTERKTWLRSIKSVSVEGWDFLNGLYQVIPEEVEAALSVLLEKSNMTMSDLPWRSVDGVSDDELSNIKFSFDSPSTRKNYLRRADILAEEREIQADHLLMALVNRLDDSLHGVFQGKLRAFEPSYEENVRKMDESGILPYKIVFRKTSQSNHKYKVRGSQPLKLKLNSNEIIDVEDAVKDEGFSERTGIQIIEKHTWDKSMQYVNIQTYERTILIHNAQAFPLTVLWRDQDIYTASGYGTSGSEKLFSTSYVINHDEIEEKTVELRFVQDFEDK